MARKFFVGGNWKCNGTTEEVKKIVSTLNGGDVPSPDVVEVVVSPPFVFLPLVKTTLRPDFHVAAQNCWVKNGGAYTGEVSAEMLVNLDIPWVILGHSERRSLLKESNDFVGDKVASPAQAQEVHSELRDWLQANTSPEIASTTRIIYGGSVSGGNCKELAAKPDVDGFLVGGASLKPEFIDIIKSAEVKKSS
ncbi:unnamed protein product [Linum tenue]|uniref:Triosephosphate isomerase, cytosolic n=1 Tax=Linum tenue TaxID=586396 RepID=A0AAV0JQE3_9ROSI|nr:unnamed protein product [Linum tenue]